MQNLLTITTYLPNERRSILRIIIGRLVELDAHLPHWDDDEDLFEVEMNKGKLQQPKANIEFSYHNCLH